jgi:hypothetical protein
MFDASRSLCLQQKDQSKRTKTKQQPSMLDMQKALDWMRMYKTIQQQRNQPERTKVKQQPSMPNM